ncbi:MAG: TRAP transporter substrate-binding protein [Pseudomonadota bacterium]
MRILTTTLVAGAAALFAANAAAQEVTLTLHHFLSPKSNAHTQMLEPWARAIEEDSEGRIKIEIYPAMSLGGAPPQLFRQVADGVVDIVWTVNGYSPGLFPRSEVFELPTVFTNDIVATNLAMAEMFDEWLAQEYAPVHVLFNHVHAGQALHTREKAARSPDDTKDMKLRVPGPTGIAVVEALGATPVTMPVPDLPQALSTGVVDGALIPYEIIPPLQLQEVTNYQINGPDDERFGTTTFQVSMNKQSWEALPDDLKDVFTRNSGPDWLRTVGEAWRKTDDQSIKMAVEAGNEHITLTAEEMAAFNEALAPVVDAWVAQHDDFDAQALVDKARETIAKHATR